MTTDPQILVGLTTALGVLAVAIWRNRAQLQALKTAIIGFNNGDDGIRSDVTGLGDKLDRIEAKFDTERDARRQNHRTLEREIKTNRYLITRNVEELTAQINRQSEEIDLDDPVYVDGIDRWSIERGDTSDDDNRSGGN